jgi:hypothetical protein
MSDLNHINMLDEKEQQVILIKLLLDKINKLEKSKAYYKNYYIKNIKFNKHVKFDLDLNVKD